MKRHLSLKKYDPHGPLLCLGYGISLIHSKFVQMLHFVLEKLGFQPTIYPGHSFRIGAATRAAATGISVCLIKALSLSLSGSSLQHNNDVMMTSFGILGFKISISCKLGYKLLKYLDEPIISESLSLIVNESFLNGIYLDKLKPAKVVALHKKGASDNLTNYRPISLLSVFSKIIGKLVHKRLYDF